MRSEKGSITVYVLLAMLTLTAFLMSMYVKSSSAEMAQIETTEKIKAIYENYNIDEIYAAMTGSIPEILNYEREIKQVVIKTIEENGISVDQNGKEILYYAATTEAIPPEKENVSETQKTFGQWQKSKEIDIPYEVEDQDIYIWIINKDGHVSKAINPIRGETVRIGEGEYAKDIHKRYTDANGQVAYIPAGFTVSNVAGEKNISDGLVIYSGDCSNVADMRTIQGQVNQYVWIPIDNPRDLYGTDIHGNRVGKLYNFDTSGNMTPQNWTEESGNMNWTSVDNYREPIYLSNTTSGDDYNQNINGIYTITQEKLQKEFQNMITSIEKYHGFYIGRYEITGQKENPTIIKGDWPLVNENWYSFYEIATKIEQKTSNKVSTSMIWGCEWDQAIKKSIQNKPNFLSEADQYGVYSNSTISYRGVTGRMQSAYNIFDMGGNVWDWTAEAYGNIRRVVRGGFYGTASSYIPASGRRSYEGSNYKYANYGSRAQLYLL